MKKQAAFFRLGVGLLSILMCIGTAPMAAFAASYDTSVSGDYFNVISKDEYALAPGATEIEMVLNNAAGNDRKIAHIFEVDTTNENIEVVPGYYGIDKLNPDDLAGDSAIWSDGQLTKTVKYYEDVLGYNVVGAMNTALAYDSNAPYGYMVWNGVVLGTPEIHSGANTYLAIDAEGNCELRSMSTPLNGSEVTAISANFGWLVKDGKLQTTKVERTSSDASRSMIGIKADGTLIFCQVDGRNAPTSTGLSNYEMGEMMLALGCVNAVNCDGGGSSTFVSKREGETENTMRSIPSDGSERPTINSVIIVSKAQATGIFDHATIDSAYDYVAPGATMSVTATGVDAGGYLADIPTDVSWKLSDASYGSVEMGVFTSNGKAGEVAIQMVYGGKVVGEKKIAVVTPDSFGFDTDSTVIPYGKSVELNVVATYGADDWAVCLDGAYTLTLSDTSAATLNGNTLTATSNESVKGVNVTATYTPDSSKTGVLKVTYGKGSEIVFDFEDGDISHWMGFDEAKQWNIDNGVNNTLNGSSPIAGQFSESVDGYSFLATKENGGQVRNGQYALGFKFDNTDADFAGWTYNIIYHVGAPVVLRDVANGKNATTFGMWVYIPEGAAGLAMQLTVYKGTSKDTVTSGTQLHFYFTTADGSKKNLNSCSEADIPESRWVYATADLTADDYVSLVDPTGNIYREPTFIRTYVKPTAPAELTFYFDDFTLDYSSAVEDRVLPTIGDVSYATTDTAVSLENGAAINGNTLAFSASIADNAGLDYTTGKIYVDGIALSDVTASGKTLISGNVTLTAGVHTVTFEIKDKLGNAAKVTRTFTIAGNALITLDGHNDKGNLPEYDSIYYVDINTANISAINSITTTLKLQTANTWELDHMIVAAGFNATYVYNEYSRLATITVEKVGETSLTGAQTLVSIPVRVWSWDAINHITGEVITPEAQFKTGYCPIVKIDCEVVYGAVELTDDYASYVGAFGGAISVTTNLNDNVNPWHYHTATPVDDCDETCTTDGYTGRTYCNVCGSVVDWGTTIPATGHSYEFVNGVLQCEACDVLFNGEYTDGNYYFDGVIADGWVGNSCFVNGVKLTGIQMIDGYYYDLGEDGVTTGKLTGLFMMDGKTYYAIAGNIVKGWQLIGNNWYHFTTGNGAAYNGTYSQAYFGFSDKLTYTFENGKLLSGAWSENNGNLRYYYGPTYYKRTWATIDGADYYFSKDGYPLTGYQLISPNLNDKTPSYELYKFAEDGKLEEKIDEDGLHNIEGKLYYIENGVCVYNQLVKIGENYYYLTSDCTAAVDQSCYISESKTNGLLAQGTYQFDAEGKLIMKNGFVSENGELHYYVNGARQYGLGLLEMDGGYYYINNSGVVATGNYYVSASWTGNKLPSATYDFGEDGKLTLNAGTIEIDGETKYYAFVPDDEGLHYYINARRQYSLGLIMVDGYRYYVNNKGIVATGEYYLNASWTQNQLPSATYNFGEDGKLDLNAGTIVIDGETKYYAFVEYNGKLGYYINAKGQFGLGLITVNGDRYYVNSQGVVATGEYYLNASWTNNELASGTYDFGEDGKLIGIVIKNGFMKDNSGVLRYYVDGVVQYGLGLITVNGDRYYINGQGVVATGEYYLQSAWTQYQLPTGTYNFGEDGKLILA